jgi:hypothetical protein
MSNAMVSANEPENNVVKIDSISEVPYRIGYSFRQPKMLKPVTKTDTRPFFAMDWAIKGPSQVKEELYRSGKLQRFPTVWRRAAKMKGVQGLGVIGNRRELPSFNELGAAPGPTDAVTVNTTQGRDFFGFLNNAIKTVGGAIAQRQQLEIVKAQAQAPQYPVTLPAFYTSGEGGGIGMLGWASILGGVGVAAYLYMKRQ